MITLDIASKVLVEAFKQNNFSEKFLPRYENMWRKKLGREIKFGRYFHKFYSKLNDNSIDSLFDAAKKDGLLKFISAKGKFDWHKTR